MPEESAASLRKLRALLTSGPRLPAWSAQLAGPDQLQETVRDLTRTFLVWVLHCHPVQSVKVYTGQVSGGEPARLLADVLTEQEKAELVAAGPTGKR